MTEIWAFLTVITVGCCVIFAAVVMLAIYCRVLDRQNDNLTVAIDRLHGERDRLWDAVNLIRTDMSSLRRDLDRVGGIGRDARSAIARAVCPEDYEDEDEA